MLSGKNQAGTQPYAYGSMLQASTYGATLPVGYGLTISPLLAIWAANLRQGGPGSKKGKGSGKKGGPPSYTENITFAIGHNPVVGVNQMWNNGGTYPLNYTSQTFTGPGPWTITDPHFYAVLAVSVTESYSVAFNDFGGKPVSESGTYQVPLWNELMNGPDPVRNSGYRNYPYCYKWQPSYGATVQADAKDIFSGAVVTIHYAQLTAATSFQSPLAKNFLHFEEVLGDGDEYTGNFIGSSTPLSSQQILYPMYSGAGAKTIDLGSAGVIPQLQGEMQFKWGLYSSGDADFADMIEDIFKSGFAQAAIGAASGTLPNTRLEHGLSCYNFPGTIQMKCLAGNSSASLAPIGYNLAVTEGNFLVVVAVTNGSGGGALSIADDAGNSYTAVISGSPHYQVWYAQANATGPLTVTVTGQGNDWGTSLVELAGVDTFDSVSVGVDGTTNIATTNAQNFPGYMLSVALYPGAPVSQPEIPLWTLLTPTNSYGQSPAQGFSIQERRVTTPATYSAVVPNSSLAASLVLAFKCVNPPTYPQPVSDFLDFASLDQVRMQCRANGLWGSLSMSSQQSAQDYLTQIYSAADAAPVFLGFKLYSIPYSEVSAVGNGAIYRAPTATGPIASLSTDWGDFLTSGANSAPIQIKTAARVNQPNVLQLQCLNRTSNYNPSVVEQPEQGSIALYGIRKADPIQNYAVQDVAIARKLLYIAVKNQQYGGDVITFQVPAKWCLLAPMDLIEISDPLANINNLPVRITSISETKPNGPLDVEAELFIYGMYDPSSLTTDTPAPFNPAVNESAGNVNCPVIFQPTSALQGFNNQPEIWIAVSSPAINYGGAQVLVSTDGGSSYVSAGDPIVGSAITGITTGDWPAAPSPDTTNDLSIDLSECAPVGTLQSYSVATQDGYQYPCIVTSGKASGAGILPSGAAAISFGDPLGVTLSGCLYSEPSTPSLPCGATITGIYPVAILGTAGSSQLRGFAGAGAASGMTGISGGSNFATIAGAAAPAEFNGASIGTSLSALIGQGINALVNLTAAAAPASSIGISGIGWAVYYTAASPIIDPTMPPPLSIPAGSGLAWAIPQLAQADPQVVPGSPNIATASATPGVPGFTGSFGYELMAYATATLTATNKYTLKATGAGNHLDRGVYGAPQSGQGCDHPTGSRFAFLNPSGQGILKVPMPAQWAGKLLYFKILSFNNFSGAVQAQSDVPAFPFMPTAAPIYSGGAGGVQLWQVNGA